MPVVVAAPLKVSRKQRAELERMARSSSLPHRVVVQSSALLLAADGAANEAIARECATTPDTVRRWRAKFEAGGSTRSVRSRRSGPQARDRPGRDRRHRRRHAARRSR